MSVPELLTWEQVLEIHQEQLKRWGGQDGFVDENVVRSAIARPQFHLQYEEPDVADLAACYLYSIATTQGFMDGNKRTAADCCATFLRMNGYYLNIADMDLYNITMNVAVHEKNQDDVADWIRERIAPIE